MPLDRAAVRAEGFRPVEAREPAGQEEVRAEEVRAEEEKTRYVHIKVIPL